jgi:hypothetical protein
MRSLSASLALCTLVAVSTVEVRAYAQDRWTAVSSGVRVLHRRTRHHDGSPLVLHIAHIDLCEARGRFRATAPDETLNTTSRWNSRVGALFAVNGDFFDRSGVPLGRARGAGREFAARNTYYFGALVAARADDVPRVLERYEAAAAFSEVVSAQERIVVRGVERVDPHVDHSRQRHPRTAVGWSRDGLEMIFVVADGRSRASVGATTPELALILRDLGAWEAVRLDGGGSSTLAVRGRVINTPSDRAERAVANHLGFIEDASAAAPSQCPARTPVDFAPDAPRDAMTFPREARPARVRAVLGTVRSSAANVRVVSKQ